MRTQIRVAAVGAASAALLIGTQVPAMAGWEGISYGRRDISLNHIDNCHRMDAGQGCFDKDGDYFRVSDENADGLRIGYEWKARYGSHRHGMCVSKWGPKLKGERRCDENFREHRRIIFRGAVCDGDAYRCGMPARGSGWHGFTAWFGGPTS